MISVTTRNERMAEAYSMGVYMSEIADTFSVTRQRVRKILKRRKDYLALRKWHWSARAERKEQKRYAICKGCGNGFVRSRAGQIYHSISCYHKSKIN